MLGLNSEYEIFIYKDLFSENNETIVGCVEVLAVL